MDTEHCLSVVMPVYNEVKTISLIIARVLARPEVRELVIVDVCSTDGTETASLLMWRAAATAFAFFATKSIAAKAQPYAPDLRPLPRRWCLSRTQTWNTIRTITPS